MAVGKDTAGREKLAVETSFNKVTITASATAEQLTAVVAKTGLILCAGLANGIDIYVGGDNTVTNNKYAIRLQPGDRTPLLPLANLNLIWVYATFTTETHDITYWVM
jgi:hypothetical protein